MAHGSQRLRSTAIQPSMSSRDKLYENELPSAILEASLSAIAVYKSIRLKGEVIDFEWRFVNGKMQSFLQIDEPIKKRLIETYPYLKQSELFDRYKDVVETGETADFTFEMNPNSTFYTFRILAVKFGDGLVVSLEEISEKKQSEMILNTALNKLKLWNEINQFAEEIGKIATWTYNLDDGQTNFSDNFYGLFGLNPIKYKNNNDIFRELIHSDDRHLTSDLLEKIQKNDLTYLELRINRPDGSARILSNRGRILVNSDGKRLYVGVAADITEQKEAEKELLRVKEELIFQANEQFNSLFNSIDDGFAILDQIKDDEQRDDFRYIEVNNSYSSVAGIPNPVGHTLRDLFPVNADEFIERYQHVANDGQSLRYEAQNPDTGRWYDIYVFKPGQFYKKRIAILFSDITRRRLNEHRQNYLIGLNEKIRYHQDATIIQKTAGEELGIKTGADLAFYSVVTEQEGKLWYYLSNIYNPHSHKIKTGFYPLAHFSELTAYHKAGKKNVVHNVAGNTRLTAEEKLRLYEMGIQAWLSVPLLKNNRLVAVLAIAQSTPRIWSDSDILILEETAELTWAAAERATAEKALRETEEKYLDKLKQEVKKRTKELSESKALLQSVFDSSPHSIGVFKIVWDKNGRAKDIEPIMLNKATEQITLAPNEQIVKKNISKVFETLKNHKAFKRILAVADTGIAADFEEHFPNSINERWLDFSIRKVNDLLVIHTQDVTGKRRSEEAMLDIKLRQQKEVLNAIIHTQEQERQRIGEALHDGVAQLLYAIQIKLQTIPPNEAPKPGLLRDINDIVSEAIKDARRISFELVPAVLKDYGLEVALRSLFQRIINDSLKLNFIIRGMQDRLPSQLEYTLYRIVQEMVNNIIKHAKATEATVEINQSLNRLMVRIRDNGKGFSEKKIDPMTSGIGLQSVRNRVKLLNGIMRVTSDVEGTRVTIRLPLENDN